MIKKSEKYAIAVILLLLSAIGLLYIFSDGKLNLSNYKYLLQKQSEVGFTGSIVKKISQSDTENGIETQYLVHVVEDNSRQLEKYIAVVSTSTLAVQSSHSYIFVTIYDSKRNIYKVNSAKPVFIDI